MATDDSLDTEQITRQATYWLDLADYDLSAARTMLTGGHLLYVGFMCHQVAEKGLKALYVSRLRATPPYIHALVKLAKLSGVYDDLSVDGQALLDILEPLNIEARYPAQKKEAFESLSVKRCRDMLSRTEKLLTWIKKKCDDELRNMRG